MIDVRSCQDYFGVFIYGLHEILDACEKADANLSTTYFLNFSDKQNIIFVPENQGLYWI